MLHKIWLKKIFPSAEYVKVPVAVGGEGSLETISKNLPLAKKINIQVTIPLSNNIQASYLINEGYNNYKISPKL